MFNERSRLHLREKQQLSSMQRQHQPLFYCRERSLQHSESPKSHKTLSHNQTPVISIANKKNYRKSREQSIIFSKQLFFSDGVKYWKPSDDEYLPNELCTESSTNSVTVCWTCSKALKKRHCTTNVG